MTLRNMNDPHGKAIKLDNDQTKKKSKRQYQHKQTLLEQFEDLALNLVQYKVKNLDKDTIYRTNPLKYKKTEDKVKKLKCVSFKGE